MPERGAFGRNGRLVHPIGGVSGQGGNGLHIPLGVWFFVGALRGGEGG